MNIKVIRTNEPGIDHLCGGEYAVCNVTIKVSKRLTHEEQMELVIHAVIENYLRSIPHDKVEELADLITEALGQLE